MILVNYVTFLEGILMVRACLGIMDKNAGDHKLVPTFDLNPD